MRSNSNLIAIILLILTIGLLSKVDAETGLPTYWEKCVVMIEKEWQFEDGTIDTVPHGTGFLFFDDTLGRILITNKHILSGRSLVFVRYNKAEFDPKREKFHYHREPCRLIDKNSQRLWKGHPNPEVDVAAIRLSPPSVKVDTREFDYPRVKSFDSLDVGEDVYFFGFPLGITGQKGMGDFPILRSGIVSYKSFEKTRIGNTVIDSEEFLIDGFSFAGNSGSPVMTRVTAKEKAKLVGIVSRHVSNFQQQVVGSDTIAFEQNTGLAIAECADRIRETLEQFRTK